MKDGFIKIACATPDLKVADCPYNADRIIELISEAHRKGVKIVCFPELSFTGYTCGDLFLQDALLRAAKTELARIIRETERLASCGIDEYKGIYGVTGFDGGDPLAIEADAYQGFVYAINTPEKENTITYCELIFCNYFLDVNYTEEVPAAYLPNGFDATPSNPYRAKMMRQDRVEYLADHEEETDMIE